MLLKEDAIVVDLSLDIYTGMPYYPGDPQPSVEQYRHISIDGVSLKRMVLGTHSGTHIDAPAHFVVGGETVDVLDPLRTCGRAKVVDASQSIDASSVVDGVDVSRSNKEEVLLIYTSYYGDGAPPTKAFPRLSTHLAHRIAEAGYRCVGIDSPTVGDAEVHRILLGSGVLVVENLSNRLIETVGRSVYFLCLPIKVRDGDGAPARALAII